MQNVPHTDQVMLSGYAGTRLGYYL